MSFGTLLVLIVSSCVLAWLYIRHAYSYWKRRGVPYLKPKFPFGAFANGFLQKISIDDQVKEIYDLSTEPFVGVYSLMTPVILFRDPELIRTILIKDFANFPHRGWYVNEDVDPMAHNMLVQNGEAWRNSRTKLSPSFTTGRLKAMFQTIMKCGDSLDGFISEYAKSGEVLEIREVVARFATNVIASVSFGIEIDSIKYPDSEFREYGKQFFEPTIKNMLRNTGSFFAPSMAKLFRSRFVDKDVGDFMIDTVRDNLQYREKHNITQKDFFQMLMQLRNTGKVTEDNDDWSTKMTSGEKLMSINEMAAQAHVFFVAGYESNSTTMSFCMYELAKHPETQQKVYKEIVAVLERYNGQLTYDSLAEMKYMENCIEETLRMHTPFGFFTRRCVKDYRIPNSNVVIEKGIQVMISVDGIHYDPKYYKEPMRFMPERFSEEKVPFIDRPFLSFGDGPRNCIGLRFAKLQTKLGVVLMLRRFKFELSDSHKDKKLKMLPQGLAKLPSMGINLKVSFRDTL
ncbi:probable cytochrome P450 6d5 [Sitodiplosis mosellana]|uniref:probable cytochrome P450 6d5 n=1 Tax=Sitodiplosis mosellana TaxID=263140 RepID=UPI002444CE80|nr:probable cytochrome P450 6d5 [Sitodiplosis mosellana]